MEVVSERRPADVLLDFFNSKCQSKVKPNEKNLKLIEECFELCNQNVSDIEAYMEWYFTYKIAQDLKPDFEECIRECGDYCSLSLRAKEIVEDNAADRANEKDENHVEVDIKSDEVGEIVEEANEDKPVSSNEDKETTGQKKVKGAEKKENHKDSKKSFREVIVDIPVEDKGASDHKKPDFEECIRECGDYYSLSLRAKEIVEDNAADRANEKDENYFEADIKSDEVGEIVEETNEDKPVSSDGDKETTGQKKVKGAEKKEKHEDSKKSFREVIVDNPVEDKGTEKGASDHKEKRTTSTENNQLMLQGGLSNAFGPLGVSMAEMIQNIIIQTLSMQYSNMLNEIKKEVMSFVEDQFGEQVNVVKVKFDDDRLTPIEDEPVHEKLQEILNFVIANEPVYLVGPTGCGKNHVCKQVAKIMNLPFYFSNAITQEYKLTGFTDANGVYHETQFFKAFKDGGVFLLDEIDASVPDALIVLNAALSNGYFDFPAPIGYVEAHPDFRVIAAGNTWGNGADLQYVGRNQLDMASLDRFAVVSMDYSKHVEKALCPNNKLQTFLRQYRKAIFLNGLMTTVSYRVFRRMYLMEERYDNLCECLDSCLCKGLCKDDLMMIHKKIRTNSKYKDALKELADTRRE